MAGQRKELYAKGPTVRLIVGPFLFAVFRAECERPAMIRVFTL